MFQSSGEVFSRGSRGSTPQRGNVVFLKVKRLKNTSELITREDLEVNGRFHKFDSVLSCVCVESTPRQFRENFNTLKRSRTNFRFHRLILNKLFILERCGTSLLNAQKLRFCLLLMHWARCGIFFLSKRKIPTSLTSPVMK